MSWYFDQFMLNMSREDLFDIDSDVKFLNITLCGFESYVSVKVKVRITC